MDFEGRAVVVTGASGVLGRAVASVLAGQGATCHLPVRGVGADERLAWAAQDRRFAFTQGVDLADERSVEKYYASLPSVWASIHCAGGFSMAPLEATSLAELRSLFDINMVTAFLCTREAARHLRRIGAGGRIVNVVARPALEPRTGARMTAYTASKAALAALTVAAAEELSSENIWVNAVAPAILDTPANRAALPRADFTTWTRPEEVAAAIAFLASPANACVRGAIVPVSGRG